MIAPVCRRLRSSPYAHLRRVHSPLLLPRLMSGFAAHAAARSMVTASVAAGLGFSVASLPQCRRGTFLASINAVRRLPQGRYAVGCAASGKKKRRGFASVSAAYFLTTCTGGGWGGGVCQDSAAAETPAPVYFGSCRATTAQRQVSRWAIVDGARAESPPSFVQKINTLCRALMV